jgi:lysozyme
MAGMSPEAVLLAAKLCRHFEGLYLRPYMCPAAVATIGYGSTLYEDGSRVSLTDPAITRERAEALLLHDLMRRRAPGVSRLCPGVQAPGLQAALLDFAFNLGLGALAGSTLRKRVNAGQLDAVPTELRKWVRGGGRVLRGLELRREAEIALIDSGHRLQSAFAPKEV